MHAQPTAEQLARHKAELTGEYRIPQINDLVFPHSVFNDGPIYTTEPFLVTTKITLSYSGSRWICRFIAGKLRVTPWDNEPELPSGFEIAARGFHRDLYELSQTTHPEFKKMHLALCGQDYTCTWAQSMRWTFEQFGTTGMNDMVILYREIEASKLTLNDIQDGDVFTSTQTIAGAEPGEKMMRYYDHLVILGKPGGDGVTKFFPLLLSTVKSIPVTKTTI